MILHRPIFSITLGVPQRIHEYCECLAYNIEDNDWVYEKKLLDSSDQQWLIKGLRECYVKLSSALNSDVTVDGRRNQVIYSLGINTSHEINTQKIANILADEFTKTALGSNSGIGNILAHLSKGDNPILKKISGSYIFTNPRFLMCIRVILYKDPETEKVIKKKFKLN